MHLKTLKVLFVSGIQALEVEVPTALLLHVTMCSIFLLVLGSVYHALCMLFSSFVSGLGLVLLLFCYYAMPVWCHINQSINQSVFQCD